MKLFKCGVAAALLLGVVTVNAQERRQGGASRDPAEAGQAAERDVHGAPHGSAANPSPHGASSRATTGESRRGTSDPKQGGPIGQPPESGQAAERDIHGAPHGSSTNPSPH